MNSHKSPISRRHALSLSTHWFVSTAIVSLAVAPSQVRAKAAKSDFYYRDKEKDGKSCATCKLFAQLEPSRGTCAVVEGDVSPGGWCIAYSART